MESSRREVETRVFLGILILAFVTIPTECSPLLGGRRSLAQAETIFDVTQYGAKPDGQSDSAIKFIRAWNAACHSSGPAKLVVPPGNFLTGETVFQGPCTAKPITIEIQGTVLSSTDLSVYTRGAWIMIEYVDGVTVTGQGTLDGQGGASWKYAGKGSDSLLPVSLIFEKVTNSVIQNIKVVNSKGFHLKVTDSSNIVVTNMNITAPGDSPNTDGLHISSSKNVNVTSSIIGTGDDCVSIGEGNVDILVSGITCGPGHGISVGSLGKRQNEANVKGVTVTNCTLIGTTNGARIKTYHASPELQASGIVYENIVMDNVKNPIIIDQNYNSKSGQPSSVKISDVHFRNIRGTTITPIAIALSCSKTHPCEGVELADINLTPALGIKSISSACDNAAVVLKGSDFPPGCH